MSLVNCRERLHLPLGRRLGGRLGSSYLRQWLHPSEEKKMTLAAASSSYPLLNVFWTMFEFFLWVIWIWVLIAVFIDIFRSSDLSGWGKALWFLFVLLIPLFGVLIYLIVRGATMHERSAQRARQQDEAFRSYVRSAADSPADSADQLARLADLRDRGTITTEEFERGKAKILS
jgi:ABC-type Fe3+ transport system permease subunit